MSQYLMARINDNGGLTGSVSGNQVLNWRMESIRWTIRSRPFGDEPPEDEPPEDGPTVDGPPGNGHFPG